MWRSGDVVVLTVGSYCRAGRRRAAAMLTAARRGDARRAETWPATQALVWQRPLVQLQQRAGRQDSGVKAAEGTAVVVTGV